MESAGRGREGPDQGQPAEHAGFAGEKEEGKATKNNDPRAPAPATHPPHSPSTQVQAARHTAALVVAKVAAIDLPARAWPELVPSLLSTIAATPPAPAPLRTSTLEALGYVCEEMAKLEEDVLEQATVNSVLTAVVAGMRAPAPTSDGAASTTDDAAVRLAATRALYNALEFAATNFDNPGERTFLMQCVCEAACAPRDPRVREAAFECLVKIAASHYDKLPQYMQDLFALTYRAVREDGEDVAKQAIEFWCTIADEEIDAADAADAGEPNITNHRFIAQALAPLTQLLLDQLTKQEDGQDTDDGAWNVCMAGGTALGLAARAAGGDAILPLVSPYVSAGLSRPDDAPDAWRAREAAAFALGSIVDGPPPTSLAPLAAGALPRLLDALRDPSSQVRHTAAWTAGRVFEFAGAALPAGAVDACVGPLLAATADAPHVADKACFALSQLALAAADAAADAAASATSGGGAGGRALPARAVQEIMAALFALADRCAPLPDAAAGRAAASAYEAINEVVRCSPDDALPLVGALIPATLAKLAAALRAAATSTDACARRADLISLLCGVLTVALQRLAADDDAGKPVAAGHADAVMEAVLAVLADAHAAAAGGDASGGTADEEALLTAGALTFAVGPRFATYLPAFAPALDAALARPDDAAACSVAVGVLGDVARAVDSALTPYAPRLLSTLLTALRSPDVRREVKPPILSAFGDVALALGPGFAPLAGDVVPTLAAAASLAAAAAAAAAPDDDDALEYTDALRAGVAEAYSGLFNGLSAGDGATPPAADAALATAGPPALDFAADVASRADGADPAVVRAVVSLVGDVAATVPGAGAAVAQRATLAAFLRAAAGAADPELQAAGRWAVAAVTKSGG